MMILAAFFLAFAGFAVIAASMGRHQDQLGTEGLAPARLKAWRLAGYALLALSLPAKEPQFDNTNRTCF